MPGGKFAKKRRRHNDSSWSTDTPASGAYTDTYEARGYPPGDYYAHRPDYYSGNAYHDYRSMSAQNSEAYELYERPYHTSAQSSEHYSGHSYDDHGAVYARQDYRGTQNPEPADQAYEPYQRPYHYASSGVSLADSTYTSGKRSYHSYASNGPDTSPPSSQPSSQPSASLLYRRSPLRSPVRSPSPPPRPPSPSPTYLALTTQPSSALATPSSSRKLLVLDLNGSLLLRSKFKTSAVSGGPQVRRVHPRPYLATFVDYLLHERTRPWLDVMVWSSAQPHSVDDMVHNCFGRRRDALRAVWARDTLGLTEADYHRKSQTTKDLAKPWAQLPIPSSAPESPSDVAPASDEDSEAIPGLSSAAATYHSALTTLLLDDSPLKARLQPWNHVCIREYVQEVRNKDLRAKQYEEAVGEHEEAESRAASVGADSRASTPAEVAEEGEGKKAKKKRVRRSKREKMLAEAGEEDGFDPTLLAVVGILDAVKRESNVASWIRSGGLWGPAFRIAASAKSEVDVVVEEEREGSSERGAGMVAAAGNDAQSDAGGDEHESAPAPMWFEDAEVLNAWAARGRRACEELGVEVVHGIDG